MKQLNTCIVDRQIVEAALLEHPLIDDCVVLVRKKETSRRELVAYIVFAGSFSYLAGTIPLDTRVYLR
jgi:acyl-coenzyme A synthetase/AMP-(fatty) acid ligase